MVWDLIASFAVGVAVGFGLGFIAGVEIRTLDKPGFRRVLALIATALFAGALWAHVTVATVDIPTLVFGILGGGIAYYFHTGGTAAESSRGESK